MHSVGDEQELMPDKALLEFLAAYHTLMMKPLTSWWSRPGKTVVIMQMTKTQSPVMRRTEKPMGTRRAIMNRFLLLAMVWLLVPVIAQAQAWGDLSAEQRTLLAPFADQWADLPDTRRQKLLGAAQRWQGMTEGQRQRARKRMETWNQLSPAQQRKFQQRFQRFQQLSPEQQQRLRKQFKRFRKLSPEQRRHFKKRWRNMSPEQKREAKRRLHNKRNH